MTSPHDQIKKDHNLNSPAVEKLIQDGCNRLADIDAQRAELNDEAKEIREGWKDAGLDPQAVMSKYVQFKKKRKPEREGYTQSEEIAYSALNKMDQRDLFKELDERDARLAAEREKNKKEKKPKSEKSVGEQQAAAIMAAGNKH